MTDVAAPFSPDEYASRVTRLRAEMQANNLDALMLTTAPDIYYVTGFLTRFWESPARPWFVIVPAKGSPVAVIPTIGVELMQRTFTGAIRTWDAPVPGDDGVTLLADTLCDLLPETAQIGTPMGLETHLRMPLADFARVQSRIHPRTFVDGTAAVQRVREIKSDAEIARIRSTCAVADRAFDRVHEIARAGVPLSNVFRQFQGLLLEEGADWVSYVAGASDTGGYSDVISPASNTPIMPGDVLMLDTGAVLDGYFCDFDRNFSVGPIADGVRSIHEALWDVTEDVLRALEPGMRASDAHHAFASGLRARGVEPGGGRLGHGLGLTLTEWPSFTPLDHTKLRAGMVLTLEPGAVIAPGRTLVHEENIVLRAEGAELLSSRAPREMVELST